MSDSGGGWVAGSVEVVPIEEGGTGRTGVAVLALVLAEAETEADEDSFPPAASRAARAASLATKCSSGCPAPNNAAYVLSLELNATLLLAKSILAAIGSLRDPTVVSSDVKNDMMPVRIVEIVQLGDHVSGW